MITVYAAGHELSSLPAPSSSVPGVGSVWVDLHDPTLEEYAQVEERIGLTLPRREDMAEIEASSRVYSEGHGIFLTLVVPFRVGESVRSAPVTFVITRHCLTTIRFVDLPSFDLFTQKIRSAPSWSSVRAFTEIIEIIVDRAADGVERIGGEIERLSHAVFGRDASAKKAEEALQHVVMTIGRRGEDLSRIRDALLSTARGIPYLMEHAEGWSTEDLSVRLKTVERDVASLQDYDGYLAGKVSFLLDATLGLINIEQNKIIKVFTVISLVFMPPTLIAGIYGMNFKNMPEYDLPWGYPAALLAMLVSALGPYIYFKRRGWF